MAASTAETRQVAFGDDHDEQCARLLIATDATCDCSLSTRSCDRCGRDDAPVFTECPVCGPIPLCAECAALHRLEMVGA